MSNLLQLNHLPARKSFFIKGDTPEEMLKLSANRQNKSIMMNIMGPFSHSMRSDTLKSKSDQRKDKDFYEKRTKVEEILCKFKTIEKTVSLKKGRMD